MWAKWARTSEPQQFICHKLIAFHLHIQFYLLSLICVFTRQPSESQQYLGESDSSSSCLPSILLMLLQFSVIIIYTTLIAPSVLIHYCCPFLLHFSLLISPLSPFISPSASRPIANLWSAHEWSVSIIPYPS